MPASDTPRAKQSHPKESIKDTLISIVIAFVLAFVGRSFLIEPFVIPTGSMAPTLLGAHMRFQGQASGQSWTVGPWDYPRGSGSANEPVAMQGTLSDPIAVHDPDTGELVSKSGVRLRSGDRILVLKYLYAIREPQRFDVVVFKNPHGDVDQNYIKRLLGLPNEDVALVDGDVFTRPKLVGGVHADPPLSEGGAWAGEGWEIARKPIHVQRAVWQQVFSSESAPLISKPGESRPGAVPGFRMPWVSVDGAIDTSGRDYRCAALKPGTTATLKFDQDTPVPDPDTSGTRSLWRTWTIDDRYAFDENRMTFRRPHFPVSDVRMTIGVEPAMGGDTLIASARLALRGTEYLVSIGKGFTTMDSRPLGSDAEWQRIAQAECPPLKDGRPTDLEIWHADQAFSVFVDGQAILRQVPYECSPSARILRSTGRTLREILEAGGRGNALADTYLYRRPEVQWEFRSDSTAAFTLRRVGIARDLHYQPSEYSSKGEAPALATHPLSSLHLGPGQFFTCGDNSPASLDGRLWSDVNPWVNGQIDATRGIVPRRLMLGKAFFVYFPSLQYGNVAPIPDFGRMRFIW